MKKALLIAATVLLVIGMVLVSLYPLYFPYADQQRFIAELEDSGYRVDAFSEDPQIRPPFYDRIPERYQLVPKYVYADEAADRSLLAKIATNPHVIYFGTKINLSAEEWSAFQGASMDIGVYGSQDPAAFVAGGLEQNTGRLTLFSTQDFPASPEWLSQWLACENLYGVSLTSSDHLRPHLSDVFKRKPNRITLRSTPLSKQDLTGLTGRYHSLEFENTGLEPAWIPKTCEAGYMSILSEELKSGELDCLIGRFDNLSVDYCDVETKRRFDAAGAVLNVRELSY